MRHEKKLIEYMNDIGFESDNIPGFIRFTRGEVVIKIFQWSNPKHANSSTIPKSYYCLDIHTPDNRILGRLRLPLVEWEQNGNNPEPKDQVYRSFDDVVSELESVFISAIDMPEDEVDGVVFVFDDRYHL